METKLDNECVEKLISFKKVADHLGVTTNRLNGIICKNYSSYTKLPPKKYIQGKRNAYYKHSEIKEWLKENKLTKNSLRYSNEKAD